ncbi:hypothetical protein GCM10007875_28010 [Limnobacter litoralis]|uniref:Uncharacterized protein n=1 Tax=Limnobacter litoralis TaxID=481366 RepID=A0ABQ5YYD0_9BURK|nr:hypothetical protein GCM10007875_28010 [Limnobacter litoralis]
MRQQQERLERQQERQQQERLERQQEQRQEQLAQQELEQEQELLLSCHKRPKPVQTMMQTKLTFSCLIL